MSGEMEAAGAAVTAGLAAGAIEREEGKAGAAQAACANCGTALVGKFCQECGQPAHIHRTIGHLFEEALHGLLHFDTKVWRTLPKLAIRPGALTREYVMGRRARYISPLALFLLTVFLMFFAFAFIQPSLNPSEMDAAQQEAATERREKAASRLQQAEARVVEAQAALNEARAEGLPVAPLEAALGSASERVTEARGRLEATASSSEGGGAAPATAKDDAAGGEVAWQDRWRDAVRSGQVEVNLGDAETNKKVLKKLENPDLILYKLQQTAYKFSWLLVPISIPLVGLLFLWKRGSTWFDHGVFTLYSLSFASILFLVVVTLSTAVPPVAESAPILLAALPVHMFFQLKGAYGLTFGSALWRTLALLVFSSIALFVYLLGILLIALLG